MYVSWSNEENDNTIYFAADFCKADNFFDRFSSFDGKICGTMNDGKFLPKDKEELFEIVSEDFNLSFKHKVLLIEPYPSLDYSAFDLSKYSAVVHYLYHSSTACVEGDECSVLDFIDRCQKDGLRFFVAPLKKKSDKIYSSLEKILQKEIVEAMYDCSIERAYARALLEVNRN